MTPMFQLIRKTRTLRGFAFSICALTVLLAGATAASAQEQTGSITGTVTAAQGAPVAGATVTAIDIDRHIKFTGTSDAKGIYHITHLPIGRYRLESSANGYPNWEHIAFKLSFHQIARVHVAMSTVCEACTPDETAPILQTDSSEISTTIDANALASLPRH